MQNRKRDTDARHHSYLGNPIDARAWQATVHGVAKDQTRLSN